VPAVRQQFGLGAEATEQLVLVEHDLFDGVRGPVQPARVVIDPLRDSDLSFTLSALDTARGPSFTPTMTRVPMSVQRKAPECVQNVSPITKSLSSILVP
jgi:hypothetical protein